MSYWTQLRGHLIIEDYDISLRKANEITKKLKKILGPTYKDLERKAEKTDKKPQYDLCTLPVGSEDSVNYVIHKNLYKTMQHDYRVGKEVLTTLSSYVDVSFVGHLRDFGVEKEHRWREENDPTYIVDWARKVTDQITKEITPFFTFVIRYEADDEDDAWILQNIDTDSFRTQEIIRHKISKQNALRTY